DNRAQDGSLPSREASAPNHDRGNGIQFIGDAGIWIALLIFRRVENAGDSGQQPGERIDKNFDAANRKTRIPAGALIIAGGPHVPPENGPAQQQAENERKSDVTSDDDALPAEDAGEGGGHVAAESDIDIGVV